MFATNIIVSQDIADIYKNNIYICIYYILSTVLLHLHLNIYLIQRYRMSYAPGYINLRSLQTSCLINVGLMLGPTLSHH